MMICRDDRHCPLCDDSCAAYIEVVPQSVFEQVKWERDVALEQLREVRLKFAEKPRSGHWIYGIDNNIEWMKCSECLKSQTPTGVFSYCPNCGASMVNKEED